MRQAGRRINERGDQDDCNTELERIQRCEVNENPDKTNCLTTVQKDNMVAIPIAADSLAMLTPETRRKRVYDARGGRMELSGKIHPIRLADGFYLIRNLTLRECMRLQTAPESYRFPVSDSRSKAIPGNGWTVAVIAAEIDKYAIAATQANFPDIVQLGDAF